MKPEIRKILESIWDEEMKKIYPPLCLNKSENQKPQED